MPDTFKNHIDTSIDALLFNNPSLKKFVPYDTYTENSIDFNLQARFINNQDKDNLLYSNYANEIYNKHTLSVYENLPLREVENFSKLLINYKF